MEREREYNPSGHSTDREEKKETDLYMGEKMQKLHDILVGLGKEWRSLSANKLNEIEAPPEFLQKALQIVQSVHYKPQPELTIEILNNSRLTDTYIFNSPSIVLQRQEVVSSEKKILHENDFLRLEILKREDKIIMSISPKSSQHNGEYVSLSVLSALKIDYDSDMIKWEQKGPERIVFISPISSEGVKMEIAKISLDFDNEYHFRFFERLFKNIKIDLYDVES